MKFLSNDKRVIGSFQLDDYQADAVKSIYQKSYDVLTSEKTDNILLHAPVGSGKTIMGAFVVNYFKRQMHELGYTEDISFIWISPDTGGINEQSKDSFMGILEDVNVLEVQQARTAKKIPENNILFINWEKLTQSGNLMKEHTEQIVFKDIMMNTDTKKVLIIDEAHIDWSKEGDSRVMEMIDPDLTINLTATPDSRLLNRIDKNNRVFISYKQVQDAGFIKNRVIVNSGIGEGVNYEEGINRTTSNIIDLLDVEKLLLKKSIQKRERLEELTNKYNHDNYEKPLVLIQIPNANNRNLETATKENVLEYLVSQGIGEEKVSIWLANTKKNLDKIDNGEAEYLITKQAIATGWDCPRAHILVKLRETGSINFDIQTLGRIMRIPRGLDYSNDELRAAYVYTPHETFKYKGNAPDSEKDTIDELTKDRKKSKLRKEFENTIGVLGIPMYKKVSTKDIYVNTAELYDYLNKELINRGYDFEGRAVRDIQTEDTIEDFEIESELTSRESSKVKVGTDELKQHYMRSTASLYNLINIEPYITNILAQVLLCHNVINKDTSYTNTLIKVYTLYYINKAQIEINIKNAINNYERDDKINVVKSNSFEVLEEVYLGETLHSPGKNYSYDEEPDLSKESTPEQKFQSELSRNPNVKYWFKNGTSELDFSIVYEHDGTTREYYPDFFVFSESDKIYILDTKSNFEDDDFSDTPAKYYAGVRYSEETSVKEKIKDLGFNDIVFSMIKYSNNDYTPYILLNEEYTDDINEWKRLKL